MMREVQLRATRRPSERPVKALLDESGLPAEDITPAKLEHFFGVEEGSRLVGVVGLELYGAKALLRSLAVAASRRGGGLGRELVAQAERYAASKGVESIYLLTTTAQSFFEHLGYSLTARETAPEAILGTAEFSGICPVSAAFMVKHLDKGGRS